MGVSNSNEEHKRYTAINDSNEAAVPHLEVEDESLLCSHYVHHHQVVDAEQLHLLSIV